MYHPWVVLSRRKGDSRFYWVKNTRNITSGESHTGMEENHLRKTSGAVIPDTGTSRSPRRWIVHQSFTLTYFGFHQIKEEKNLKWKWTMEVYLRSSSKRERGFGIILTFIDFISPSPIFVVTPKEGGRGRTSRNTGSLPVDFSKGSLDVLCILPESPWTPHLWTHRP